MMVIKDIRHVTSLQTWGVRWTPLIAPPTKWTHRKLVCQHVWTSSMATFYCKYTRRQFDSTKGALGWRFIDVIQPLSSVVATQMRAMCKIVCSPVTVSMVVRLNLPNPPSVRAWLCLETILQQLFSTLAIVFTIVLPQIHYNHYQVWSYANAILVPSQIGGT